MCIRDRYQRRVHGETRSLLSLQDKLDSKRPSMSESKTLKSKKGMCLKKIKQEIPKKNISKSMTTPIEEEKKDIINPLLEAIDISIEEQVIGVISKDGDLGKLEVRGSVFLTINDPNKADAKIQMAFNCPKGMTLKPHIELDRGVWNSHKILTPAKASKGFSSHTRFESLKYRYLVPSSNDLPFTFTLWSSKESKTTTSVSLEIEYNIQSAFPSFESLIVTIPLAEPLVWKIPLLDSSNPTANIKFTTPSEIFSLFPFEVRFSNNYSIAGLKVIEVTDKSNQPIPYKSELKMNVESFQVVYDL
eukprot:TRINITY_DN65075_c0_g1_i1.p1 TRINITY_DN65075_c0_g1~~TRINITY_DN65075_c0_g1_i1.p1  ORF type:complete len:303 (+),score=65.71 TRINITY_DN65075_c0_g1_i1:123-1031(+)